MTDYPPTFITLTETAAADTAFKLAVTDLWLEYADVFVYTNSAYMGSKKEQNIAIYANDIYEFPYPINLADLFFKNYTGGSNAVIVICGTTLTRKKAAEYGITLPP